MPQITASLSENLINDIKKIAQNNNQSFSITIKKLLQNGVDSSCNKKNDDDIVQNKKMTNLEKKHYAHTVTALNIIMEIHKKLNNEPLKYTDQNTDSIVSHIKKNALEKLKDY